MLDRLIELGGGPAPRLHWDRDCAIACCRPKAGGSWSWETPGIPAAAQRVSLAWKEQRLSPMAAAAAAAEGNCGRPWWVGSSVPGARNTFVVFLRFFHLARLFWNQTWYGGNDDVTTIVQDKFYCFRTVNKFTQTVRISNIKFTYLTFAERNGKLNPIKPYETAIGI